jgi:hypothetical protein
MATKITEDKFADRMQPFGGKVATPVPGLRPERVAPSGQLWSR